MRFLYIITILAVSLKLMGYIAWSWWLVLSPLLVGFIISLVILLGALIGNGEK